MSSHQDFTPEQLERIESAINLAITSSHDPRTPGTVVKDILRNQDLTNARSRPITSVNNSPPLGFLQLPAEIRNMIYRYCLIVGEVYPRPKPDEDDRLNDRSNFQQPQTQVFQLCRQIFAEAAPLYFAENKFVLSYGEVPWSDTTEDLNSRPVSRVAYQNLRSLSIAFDVEDGHSPPHVLQANSRDAHFQTNLTQAWHAALTGLLQHLDLQLLEVSMKSSICSLCHRRLAYTATRCLLKGIRCTPRVVFRGLIDSEEVSEVRTCIDNGGGMVCWVPMIDDEESDGKLQIAYQVTKR